MTIKVIVGCIVAKDDKFIIVQEALLHCYGKWNLPLGHLDEGEKIEDGAKRESEEETDLKLKMDGFVGVYLHKNKIGEFVLKIIFKASVISGELKYNKGELLDAKWVNFEEFDDMPDDDLRDVNTKEIMNDFKERGALPLDTVRSFLK